MKKRIMTFFVAAALVLGLIACGKKEAAESTAAPAEEATQEAAVEETVSEEAAEVAETAEVAEAAAEEPVKEETAEEATEAEASEKGGETETATAEETSAQPPISNTAPGKRVFAPKATPEELNKPAPIEKDKDLLPARNINNETSIAFRVKENVAPIKLAYQSFFPKSQETIEKQMEELLSYWAPYNLAAVDDLIRLPRYRYVSQMLNGTNDYYYIGDTLEDGTPNGKGLAVYGYDRYYYGDFVNGLREGNGTWIQVFVKNGVYSRKNNGIIYHSYAGNWKNNLPDGEGHEHIGFDEQYQKERLTTNVIGSFSEGYYQGPIYLTTTGPESGVQEWTAEADHGTFLQATDSYPKYEDGELPVAKNEAYSDEFIWMIAENNTRQGVTGLVD